MKSWKNFSKKVLVDAALVLIDLYQVAIFGRRGSWGGIFSATRGACRFYPSCSEYAKGAFGQYGLFKGLMLSLKRILRCNPFNPGGYEPIENHKSQIPNYK